MNEFVNFKLEARPIQITSIDNNHYPIIPSDVTRNELFIRGLGRKKINLKKASTVKFDATYENLYEIYNKYGWRVACFAATGYCYQSQDCCHKAAIIEFESFILTVRQRGIENFRKFYQNIKKINSALNAIYQNKKIAKNRFFVYPIHSLVIFAIPVCLDVVKDDDDLLLMYHDNKSVFQGELPVSTKDRLTFLVGKEISNLYLETLALTK